MSLRIIFMGTPDIAKFALEQISKTEHQIIAVYSQPARKAGRNKQLQKSPTIIKAEKLGLEIFTPQNFKQKEDIEQFISLNADLAIIVAYGLILPKEILDAPKFGCLNLHASLLPRWRGAAPIQRAIMAGDKKSGVTIMKMNEGLDSGPIGLSKKIKIKKNMNAGDLHEKMKIKGTKLIIKALEKLTNNQLNFVEQKKEGVTYAKKISKSEAKINWHKSATKILNLIRGLSPYPGAWFLMEIGDSSDKKKSKKIRVKILRAKKIKLNMKEKIRPGTIIDEKMTISCKKGFIRPIFLQREGKKAIFLDEFLRGLNENLTGKELY